MATRNQMSLVVLKLQLLEDELGRLYQGIERYCSNVINKGAESIGSRAKQEEAIDDFRQAYDTALDFMKKNIMEMEKFTKVPDLTQQMKKNGSSESPMFKVISNVQTLRYLKQQFQLMITNLLSEMLQLGNRFLTNQGSQNPTQLNTRRASHDIPRQNVEITGNDIHNTGIGARRASIDTPSRTNSKPNLDKRRASYDTHRSDAYTPKWRPDIRMTGNEVHNRMAESSLAKQDLQKSKSDTTRKNQSVHSMNFDFPDQSFAEVSRQLETCLVFIMEKRFEFGETDRNEFSDILSLFGGERLIRLMPGKSQLPCGLFSKQDQSIDKLMERVDILERQVNNKTSDLIFLDATIDPLVTDVNQVKTKCDDLEDVATAQYEVMAHLNETVTSMNQNLEDLQQRFESFLRIFAANRSDSTKQYMSFDRRMSDVEKTKDYQSKLSGNERSHHSANRESNDGDSAKDNSVECNNSIDDVDGTKELFETDEKKIVTFMNTESEIQIIGDGDENRDIRNLQKREESILTGL